MVSRDLLLDLRADPIRDKADAEAFESGRHGMTRQVLQRGLATLVVGRDGIAYRPDEWPRSNTFRIADQQNLLVSDNRTRQYSEAEPAVQAYLRELAWGSEWQ
jgi:hypothetical protein